MAAGRTRLLRLLAAPAVPDRAPRVLGVDEFAFRKGCTYGTVLVDAEARRVVDVLPDRTSERFATWLTEHPRRRDHLPGPGHRLHQGSQGSRPSCPGSRRPLAPAARTCPPRWRRPPTSTATACANMPRRGR
ncbi:transposase [Streptomyces asiaticus]